MASISPLPDVLVFSEVGGVALAAVEDGVFVFSAEGGLDVHLLPEDRPSRRAFVVDSLVLFEVPEFLPDRSFLSPCKH